MKTTFIHFTGPSFPICQFPGTKVLDPFCGNDRITEDEAISILVCRDPRRNFKGVKEGSSLKSLS